MQATLLAGGMRLDQWYILLQRLRIIIKQTPWSIVKASVQPQKILEFSGAYFFVATNPGDPLPGLDMSNLIQALLADAEEHGASLALRTRIRGGQVYDTGRMVQISDGDGEGNFNLRMWVFKGVTGFPPLKLELSFLKFIHSETCFYHPGS